MASNTGQFVSDIQKIIDSMAGKIPHILEEVWLEGYGVGRKQAEAVIEVCASAIEHHHLCPRGDKCDCGARDAWKKVQAWREAGERRVGKR